jgi:hypothetical protein
MPAGASNASIDGALNVVSARVRQGRRGRRRPQIVAHGRHGKRPFIEIEANEKRALNSKHEFTLILNDKAIGAVEI